MLIYFLEGITSPFQRHFLCYIFLLSWSICPLLVNLFHHMAQNIYACLTLHFYAPRAAAACIDGSQQKFSPDRSRSGLFYPKCENMSRDARPSFGFFASFFVRPASFVRRFSVSSKDLRENILSQQSGTHSR